MIIQITLLGKERDEDDYDNIYLFVAIVKIILENF